MHTDELKHPNDIEVKFHRLTSPSLNTLFTPLSGLYNPIDNIESGDYPLKNKFKKFDLSSNKCVNIGNLLSINNSFGKVFVGEELEGLLTFANISRHDIIIRDIKILIKNDDQSEYKKKGKEQSLDIKLPNNSVAISPGKGYTIKIKTKIKCAAKYTLDINYTTKSPNYDQHYFKLKQKKMIKDKGEYYCVNGGIVEFFNNKKFSFDGNNPLKITEIFHNSYENTCLIEIHIYNEALYPLTIYDLFLSPKDKKDEKIPMIQGLENIKNNYNYSNNDNNEYSKYLMIQSNEQINLLFRIDNPDLFYDVEKFELHFSWIKHFDFLPKKFIYEFNNNINTYNKYYKLNIEEKPKEDIILNQNFKIVINLKSKNIKNKYIITLNQEPIKDNEKINDREIKIINIIEKRIELNSKISSNNFVLICKSDILGNVNMPKLKLSLYEENKNISKEYIYENLLNFNCISIKNIKQNIDINE